MERTTKVSLMQSFVVEEVHRSVSWSTPIRWDHYRANRIAPHDRSGFYVFTNHDGPLRSNADYYDERQSLRPNQSDWISEVTGRRRVVLYVGQATILKDRLSQYGDRSQGCQSDLVSLLESHPDQVWVRWASGDDWENGLIQKLDPTYNILGRTGPDVDPNRLKFRWQAPLLWDDFVDDRPQRADLVGRPGYYVFTDHAGAVRRSGPPGRRVLYVGKTTDLFARMGHYAAKNNSGDRCNRKIFEYLKLYSKQAWVRWTYHFDFEAELIVGLSPLLNTTHNY